MSSSRSINNSEIYIPIIGIDPTQKLDDTTLTAEKEYARNFSQ